MTLDEYSAEKLQAPIEEKSISLHDYLVETYKMYADDCVDEDLYGFIRPKIICKDGFTVSIQASRWHYCSPCMNLPDGNYTEVEIGFPSEQLFELENYKEPYDSDDEPQVYAFVPYEMADALIEKHGGILIITTISSENFQEIYRCKPLKEMDYDDTARII